MLLFLKPLDLNFSQDSTQAGLRKGDKLTLKCSVEGYPNEVQVSLIRTTQKEYRIYGRTKELTHTIDSVSCLDTDVYICEAHIYYTPLSVSREIRFNVNCKYKQHCSDDIELKNEYWQIFNFTNMRIILPGMNFTA